MDRKAFSAALKRYAIAFYVALKRYSVLTYVSLKQLYDRYRAWRRHKAQDKVTTEIEEKIQKLERKPLNLFFHFSGRPLLLWGLILVGLYFIWWEAKTNIAGPPGYVFGLMFLVLAYAYWWWHERRSDAYMRIRFAPRNTAQAKPPKRPPTPQEKTQAQRSMKVARAHIQDYWDTTTKHGKDKHFSVEMQLEHLQAATKSLQKTYSLDPDATLSVEDDQGTITYTYDMLAGEILYLEALAYRYASLNKDNYAQGYRKGHVYRSEKREAQAMCLKGLQAALQSVKFCPHKTLYLTELARLQAQTGDKKTARGALERALSIDPDYIEALKLAEELS